MNSRPPTPEEAWTFINDTNQIRSGILDHELTLISDYYATVGHSTNYLLKGTIQIDALRLLPPIYISSISTNDQLDMSYILDFPDIDPTFTQGIPYVKSIYPNIVNLKTSKQIIRHLEQINYVGQGPYIVTFYNFILCPDNIDDGNAGVMQFTDDILHPEQFW